MQDYNKYVTAINKIFDYLTKMKTGWNSVDNTTYIEKIEEYKQLVAAKATDIKNTNTDTLEALGND
ncbi:MAG: hypothetical protein IJ842_01690 [Bacilli bacterium]|nr:hypothetical protein [Bacilli bacterium]